MDHSIHSAASPLACYACKRRKVKCNRDLPICSLCTKVGVVCEYPAHQEKPGPKIGSTQKVRRKRRSYPSRGPDVYQSSPRIWNDAGNVNSGHAALSPTECSTGSHVRSQTHLSSSGISAAGQISQPARADGANNAADPTGPTFSQIMYPSHEAQTRPQSPSSRDDTPVSPAAPSGVTIETICEGLKMHRHIYDYLMESYFANMTSFSLFKPYTVEAKFPLMRTSMEAVALVAAMFSYSARFHSTYHTPNRPGDCPKPLYFANVASTQLEKSLEAYGDARPPLWLLQTSVLVTFFQLTRSVRSKSWRTLGSCIRLAYDMNLHLIDVQHSRPEGGDARDVDVDRWSMLEERRRAWWAVWEMDVFASTIRRLPMGIDWTQNFTFLPVPDSCWFNDTYQPSCYLSSDPNLRWKHLSKVENASSKAWFIVINSFMRNAQLIAYSGTTATDASSESSQADLTVIENCLFCASSSLPADLAYQGEALDFQTKRSSEDVSYRQLHADRYSTHLMTQLVRFMIYHHRICVQAPWLTTSAADDTGSPRDAGSWVASSWSNYTSAAEQIVTIVRTSHTEHYKYVNPFLINTLWFAAAAQIACRVFGPPSINKTVAESNYELLALAIDRFITFWSSMDMLGPRLARIEARLKELMMKDGRQCNEMSNCEDGSESAARTAAMGTAAEDGTLRGSQPLAADPPRLSLDPALGGDPAALSFGPMLYENDDLTNTVDQQFFLDDPRQFFPYGVDQLWALDRLM